MSNEKLNGAIIRIIGLLGDDPVHKKLSNEMRLRQFGFIQENEPMKDGKPDELVKGRMKNLFYPDFRKIMFLRHEKVKNIRLLLSVAKTVGLIKSEYNKIDITYKLNVDAAEVFLFPGHLGLFSVSLGLTSDSMDLTSLSDICSIVRNFDTPTTDGMPWHAWISREFLAGIDLRGDDIKADEYSGSKFKLYTVIDCEEEAGEQRDHLLFDMATASPLGAAAGKNSSSPAPLYYDKIMTGKIAFFLNWQALCLFDTFTVVGKNVLGPQWKLTYLRIYIFRLFFKYNLFRYNTYLHDSPVQLRKQFEEFLNLYNLSHISFNFLPNELYSKMGIALELEQELSAFDVRIKRLSTTIQEEKQSRTNNLLQVVTILGSVSSVGPVLVILSQAESYLGWNHFEFYTALVLVLLALAIPILYYLMPEKMKNLWTWVKSLFRKK